ncbi:glycosyltransferase family 2 protein [Defluviimonas aestuarii]|uniref:glycosyltransferase family 2 protein n=1 Tax=Albidovulum aestuarii TaxID=1130726 RepID=UPI00249BEAB9|nr:glycosyltransferase family 2 protein [Defluviimonas aestuarii]MDI3337565.1 glycosyltransferase family 2 protein [Defluviimonas aestuarii]
MKISVVITCYNKAKYIAQAIQSACEQAGVHEIIVVDDCSTDRSVAIASAIGGIKLIPNAANKGVSASTRIGVEHARAGGAEYVILLDGDDVLAVDSVRYFSKVIEQSGVPAVYSSVARDRVDDMRLKAQPCDVDARYQVESAPLDLYMSRLSRPLATTALCAHPDLIVRHLADGARVQDHQIAFSICYNADRIAVSDAVTHYCSPARPGDNLSEDAVAILTASVIVYANTFALVKCHTLFKSYQKRAYTRGLRLRHYGVLPMSLSLMLYALTPFKELLPVQVRHAVIMKISQYV